MILGTQQLCILFLMFMEVGKQTILNKIRRIIQYKLNSLSTWYQMPENSTGQFRGSIYYLLSVLLWADGDSIAYETHLFMQLVYSWIYEHEFMSEIAPTRRTINFSFTEKLLFQCDSALPRWVTEVCLVSFTILSWTNMQVMLNEQ